MGASFQIPQWRRITRQTITLTKKNYLLYKKAWISTILRALIFPIAVTLVLCLLRDIGDESTSYRSNTPDYGIAPSTFPVPDLTDAIKSAGSQKLVFVRNGVSEDDVNPAITGIVSQLQGIDTHVVDNPNDLFDLCRQSLAGYSDCFAAILFQSSNETAIEYIIALDSSYTDTDYSNRYGNWNTGKTKIMERIMPLQWAVNSHLGGFSQVSRPLTRPRGGEPTQQYSSYNAGGDGEGKYWLFLVSIFVSPVFIIILIGVVYHLAIFVATERETSMAELMAAQKVSITPRILSTYISFFLLYFPGLLICSVLMTQLLFQKTSDILLIFLTILAGLSIIVSAHFLASFFGKAQLAGLYSSTLVFALALVTLAASLAQANPEIQTKALAFVFPPIAYVTLIGDIAFREYTHRGFSLAPNITNYRGGDGDLIKNQAMNGYLYVIIFILQIIVFSLATYAVEHGLWGVTRKYSTIEASSDVAVRCTNLTKTYSGKRRWYWPFSRLSKPVKAVDALNIEVKKGSVTFLLGPNGGGKTTTLKCVAGMTAMDSGSHLELNEGGQVFGICPQHNVFWDTLTVSEHIQIWRELKTAAFDDFSEGSQDDDVAAECDIVDKLNARAKTLSGGQMRKLQLAISFVGGSNVCCIDEASSGLDPLSRRNIWNIIQKGHARRSILVTTHFLDEADVLADHIAIIHKGQMVCEGAPTSLKARFGDAYIIRSNTETSDEHLWEAADSSEATRKVLELESQRQTDSYNVVFPTLEQVFLKVTSSSGTAVQQAGGDGIVGERIETTLDTNEDSNHEEESKGAAGIDLDVGQSIGFLRQVAALYHKRFVLLTQKAGWISYGINLAIPIIIAAALAKYIRRFDHLQTCAANDEALRNGSLSDSSYSFGGPSYAPLQSGYGATIYAYDKPSALLGPPSEFQGAVQEDLYISDIGYFTYISTNNYGTSGPDPSTETAANATSARNNTLSTRAFVSSEDEMVARLASYSTSMSDYYKAPSVAIFAPTPDSSVFYYNTEQYSTSLDKVVIGFDYLTNRIANSTTTTGQAKQIVTSIRTMRHATNNSNFFGLPIGVLLVIAFIGCVSTSVIYPTFEKINRVRALQYCNGVSPAALWVAYWAFDMQFIIVQTIIVWSLTFAGSVAPVWYAPNYLFGAFILFGVASYLGCYALSLFVKKAAFAIAAGTHVLLFVIYIVAYVAVQEVGGQNEQAAYESLQYGLGLTSPAANLARALFLATNSYGVLCGKYGTADTSNGFAYVRYGAVYANLLIQILFLMIFLVIYEYGSADWLRRTFTMNRGMPPRLQHIVESSEASAAAEKSIQTSTTPSVASSDILVVSHITKYFNKLFAVEDVSFSITSNSTLALLGGNGAGKTTIINMIRNELIPACGTIHLDGINVLAEPHKARLLMGVCPQDDAVDNLTVHQTLKFYATVKGLKNIEGNVTKVLAALNITTFAHHSVRALSGGTKRKLSVAIALLGNPRVLLLDEPSTGQDAGAKRILWKALKDIRADRAILLTTHSMEEAEALATSVAIIGTKMLATGTLSSLQEAHGGAYMIRAVRSANTTSAQVHEMINLKFEGRVSNYLDGHGQVSFCLPHVKKELGRIMRGMEELKGEVFVAGKVGEKVISDYTINGPTLEEVFMNVARENGHAGGV
ncbi:P-loop containing nucleoside triphosphate hydrolase [Glarea lozoyensis ATCC 20868]|uniref:p-loop containing nucleoside triphosphate hydrolase n=1 Tax=Glarea lozoyensis (strain ATCC 20868 / MF5171) TaxID=1116229 RepID=S3CQK6_GLAL2|nr:P-loop containing nucleoside triphosphate hydrolase [Glarea lozoyensis ATCC 20868]EPE27975.1 P-loop containing nucleoside triphosphate hydrolase [Glarea lozoyensis ATCC 20868]